MRRASPGSPTRRSPSITSRSPPARARQRLAGALLDGGEVAFARALQAALSAIQRSEAYEVHAERVEREPGKYDPKCWNGCAPRGRCRGGVRARPEGKGAAADRVRADLRACRRVGAAHRRDHRAGLAAAQRQWSGQRRRAWLLGLTNPWSVLGLPAISLPAGFVDGLPWACNWWGRPARTRRCWRWRRGIGNRRALESGGHALRQAGAE